MNHLSLFAVVLVLLIVGSFAQMFHKPGHCPMRNSVICSDMCLSDGQCSGSGAKCCPNKCGWPSCTYKTKKLYKFNTGSDGGYKGFSNQGVYCGGVICRVGEKCQYDYYTKRRKCTGVYY